jgi:aspartate aminotransferase-like enzyme
MRKLIMIPGPTNVPDRVTNAMLTPMINHRGTEFHNLYRRIRANSQKVFQTSNDIVVLTGSGTAGVDAALGSILSPDDIAVVPSFGEFSSRLGDSASYTGAKVLRPEAELGDAPKLEEVEKAMKSASRIKALCTVFNETSTGVTWRRLKELGDLARKYGALFVVDAISVMGGEDLPVDKLGADICIAGSQKCLSAPPGLVIVSFSSEAKKAMQGKSPRSQYFDVPKYFQFAEHDETPSTPAVPLFFALDEALKLVLEEGIQKRFERHELCSRAFYSAFETLGLKAFAQPEFRSHTVIGINYPAGIDDKKFRALLDEKFGVVVAGGFGKLKGSMFRVGSMGEINERMITVTVSAVAESLSSLGINSDLSAALSRIWETFGAVHP